MKTNQATPILQKKRLDCVKPKIEEVAENLSAIHPDYMPTENNNGNMVVKSVVDDSDSILLSPHFTLNIFSGLMLDINAGYVLCGKLLRTWSSHGLFLSDVYLDEEKQLVMQIVNLGLESVSIPDKVDMAELWLEPKVPLNLGI